MGLTLRQDSYDTVLKTLAAQQVDAQRKGSPSGGTADLSAGCGFLRRLTFLGELRSCFTSTKTVGLLGTGAQDVHLDFHTAPEL